MGSAAGPNECAEQLFESPDTNQPNNQLWNPATDGPLLSPFLNMPPNSPVGIGLALRTTQISSATLAAGVPVRLSRFSISPVSLQYIADSPSGVLASGNLQFAPGETVKLIDLSGISLSQPFIRLTLSDPSGGELTSLSRAYWVNVPDNTLLAAGSVWKYLDTAADQGTAWRAPGFPDGSWPSGRAQLGFGDGDEATVIASNRQYTTYFRSTFTVQDPSAYGSLSMWLLRDDGGVVFINGNEVFRSPNFPAAPTPIPYATLTSGAAAENAIDTANLSATNLVAGNNLVAVEIHQQALTSSDVSFDFSLTGVATAARPRINFARLNDELVMYWTDAVAVLEEASQVTGPWSQVSAGSQAYGVSPGSGQKFYRLKK